MDNAVFPTAGYPRASLPAFQIQNKLRGLRHLPLQPIREQQDHDYHA